MRRAELLRLFVKSDTPAAPKSASQPDPFGIIVRHKLTMAAFYRRIFVLSRKNWKKIKFIFNKLDIRFKHCFFGVFAIESVQCNLEKSNGADQDIGDLYARAGC
jgi:hypothetical protein